MSLNWNVESVENFEEVCFHKDADGDRALRPLVHRLIFQMMTIGLGAITEQNWEEAFRRLAMMGKLDPDAPMGCDVEYDENGHACKYTYRDVRPDEIRALIGLHTNVSPLSAREFDAHFVKCVRQDVERELTTARKVREAEEAA